MTLNRKNDQIFQLSLTEIAFTLVFILLLLLGYLIYREQTAREAAEAELSKMQGIEISKQSLLKAKEDFSNALTVAGVTPEKLNETISKLSAAQDIQDERDQLKKQVEKLDAQLSALTEFKKQLEKSSDKEKVLAENVASALALQSEIRKTIQNSEIENYKNLEESNSLRKENKNKSTTEKSIESDKTASESKTVSNEEMLRKVRDAIYISATLRSEVSNKLDKNLNSENEKELISLIVSSAKKQADALGGQTLESTRKENSDLRGQVAFYKRRLEARGGRDYPPCWATESGSPEYIFSIELTPSGVFVNPSWPAHRESDARALS